MKGLKKYCAEFIGTFVLVLIACGVAVKSGCEGEGPAGVLITAVAFGAVIIAMAYSIGNISGCHINPAASIAVWINKGMTTKDFIFYLIAQFAGAIAGAAVLGVFLGCDFSNLGANNVSPGIWQSILIEAVLTCVFVLAVLGATSKASNSNVAGLVIGGSLTLVHLLGIYLTGTSVNPARSFGPALLQGGDALACSWVFIVAPLAGGVIAALIWKLLWKGEDKQ